MKDKESIINKYQSISKVSFTFLYNSIMDWITKINNYRKEHPETTDKDLIAAIKIPRATFYRLKKNPHKKARIIKPIHEYKLVNGISIYKLDQEAKVSYIEALYTEALAIAREQKDARVIIEIGKALTTLNGLNPLTKQRMELTQININQIQDLKEGREKIKPELTIIEQPLDLIKQYKPDDD